MATGTRRNKNYILWLLLIAAPVAVYFPTVGNDFLYYWDDQWQVTNRFTSGGFSWSNISAVFSQFSGGQYSPVNQMIYTFIYTFWGYDPAVFHIASLIAHIFNAMLIFHLITGIFSCSTDERSKGVIFIAFATAFLFAVHPVNVESIAWISASKIPFYTFFYLSGLAFYLKYVKTGRTRWYLATLAAFVLSFGCKEQTVTFPLCLLLIDWFMKRNLRNENVWAEKISFFVLALFFGIITLMAQGMTGGSSAYPLWQRLLFSCYALFEYITKLLLPLRLNYLYPFPMDAGEPIPARFWIYPLLLAGLIILVCLYRKNRMVMFGVLLFIIHLALCMNILSMGRYAMIADRYLYIGETGIFFIIAYAVHSLYINLQGNRFKKYALIIFSALYLSYLGGYTFNYTKKWKDSDTVKRNLRELAEKEFGKKEPADKELSDKELENRKLENREEENPENKE
jgi:hypothetical protein